jgi:hypothetical protein
MDIICERIDVFTVSGRGYISMRRCCKKAGVRDVASGTKEKWRSGIALGFRAMVIGQTIALFGQALIGGLALSGEASALDAHMVNGGIALVISLAQVVFGLLMKGQLPRWALIASVTLLFGEGMQMASGRLHLFFVHLPLGLVLFAGLVPVVLWIVAGGAAAEEAGNEAAVRSSRPKLSIGGR